MRTFRFSRVVCLSLLAALLCARAQNVAAQSVAEPALKAAFLYNFAKFTEWPADALPSSADLRLCVTDNAVAVALEGTIVGRSIGDHALVVARVMLPTGPTDDTLRSCALLYATGLDSKRATVLIASLEGASVFSVSDFSDFTALGGIAHFVVEGERMRLAINPAAAKRSHLRLSSQLLSLARLVKDRSN